MGRSKWIAISVLAVGISLLWKPIVVLVWRASHPSRIPFHAHILHVGFPWVVVANRGDTVKAETFSTLRPTLKDKFSRVIFDRQTDQMSSEDDKTWLQERSRIFAEHGFQKTDGRFFLDGRVLCAESQLEAGQSDYYCRSLDGFTIAYVGNPEHLQSALKILDSLSKTSK
jgi:hypothetical protein